MNFFPMNAGGGSLKETTLWTNPSPSSSFATQNVLLSDDINNYDYIGIEYGYNINTQSDGREAIFMKVSDFKTTNSNVGYRLGMSVYQGTNNNAFNRICNYIDDTHISFISCAQYGSGGYTTNNNMSIPTRIIGVKKTSDNVALNITGANIGTLARYASTTITIDLDKDYVLWEALLQDDSTYRACCYSIRKGVISHIPNSGNDGNGYITNSISGNILTLTQRGAAAAASARYGLIQLD